MVASITSRISKVDQTKVDHQFITETAPLRNAPANRINKKPIVYSTIQPITVGYIAIEAKSNVGIRTEEIRPDIDGFCSRDAAAPIEFGSVLAGAQPLDISVHY